MPLPFDLPRLSSGFAALDPTARRAGRDCAAAAARSLGALLGAEVRVQARPLPGVPAPRGGVGRAGLDLAALPGAAVLEADADLVVRLVDRLAGGDGRAAGALALTPVEASALHLFVLAALDGACGVPDVERALAPRLAPSPGLAPEAPIALELAVTSGSVTGRARLLVPAAAVRALAEAGALAGSGLRLGASLRGGAAPLAPGELEALAPGDVVVLDGGDEGSLVLPGGARVAGRLGDDGFHVEGDMERMATLPVTLEVELARVEVTLGDLARLEPGAVLPLGLDRGGRVALVVGERTVARGELVDVEGAVGVRVLEVTT